jgi:hypothetical protein
VHHARDGRERAPHREAGADEPRAHPGVGQAADRKADCRVHQRERRAYQPELRVVEAEFLANRLAEHAGQLAVEEIEQVDGEEQQQRPLRVSWLLFCAHGPLTHPAIRLRTTPRRPCRRPHTCHDDVTRAESLAGQQRMAREPLPAHAERMSNGDGAAIDVEPLIGNAEPIATVEHLHGEGFIELPEPDVLHREPGTLQ